MRMRMQEPSRAKRRRMPILYAISRWRPSMEKGDPKAMSYYQSFLSCVKSILQEQLRPKIKHRFSDKEIDLFITGIMEKVDEACKDHGVDWKLDGEKAVVVRPLTPKEEQEAKEQETP